MAAWKVFMLLNLILSVVIDGETYKWLHSANVQYGAGVSCYLEQEREFYVKMENFIMLSERKQGI